MLTHAFKEVRHLALSCEMRLKDDAVTFQDMRDTTKTSKDMKGFPSLDPDIKCQNILDITGMTVPTTFDSAQEFRGFIIWNNLSLFEPRFSERGELCPFEHHS